MTNFSTCQGIEQIARSSHSALDRKAAVPAHLNLCLRGPRRVRRAGIDFQGRVVPPQLAVLDDIYVGGVGRHRDKVRAQNPGVINPGIVVESIGNDFVIEIAGIKNPGKLQLFSVAHAPKALGFGLRFGERWQQHARQDRDNGNDHQQFDEGEGGAT